MTDLPESLYRRAQEGIRMLELTDEVASVHLENDTPRASDAAEIISLVRRSNVSGYFWDDSSSQERTFSVTYAAESPYTSSVDSEPLQLIPHLGEAIDDLALANLQPTQIGRYVPGHPYIVMRKLSSDYAQGLLGVFEYSMARRDRQGLLQPDGSRDNWDYGEIYDYVVARLDATSLVVETLCELDASGRSQQWSEEQITAANERALISVDETNMSIVLTWFDNIEHVAQPPDHSPAAEIWDDPYGRSFIEDTIVVLGIARSALQQPELEPRMVETMGEDIAREYIAAIATAGNYLVMPSIRY